MTKALLFLVGLLLVLSYGSSASAESTFYLDRLKIGGSPDDGVAIWRPRMKQETVFFGQAALGWQHRPLRGDTVMNTAGQPNPVQDQFTTYFTAGLQLVERLSLSVTLPVVAFQSGSDPCRAGDASCEHKDLNQVVPGDLRIDGRVIAYRSTNRKFHLGAALIAWIPTGDKVSFTSDDSTTFGLQVLGEYDFGKVILTGNTGLHSRPHNGFNAFRVGTEWTWGVGGFIPLRQGDYRLGLSVFGSTGLVDAGTTKNALDGSTVFTKRNTPVEWMGEFRMALGRKKAGWAGAAGGTRMSAGYGAPDVRLLLNIGYAFSLSDAGPKAPPPAYNLEYEEPVYSDRDGDGIPDDLDKCPDEPEDGKPPFPDDGCPAPDVPDPDTDMDGIPDKDDACPKEPGPPNVDPKLNGCPQFIRRVEGSTEIQILKRVEFKTSSTELLPESFPILDEVYALLSVNLDVRKVSIEGHTDSRGSRPLNTKLSQGRATSVMNYLVNKGIDADRLSAAGFGPDRPIADNETADGRQQNRRVEFKIVAQE
ncbi:MAG: OmpA family protein [Polyangiaceae bacterium]|nr:OmpA family protein [Polyangiaceae bacterium]